MDTLARRTTKSKGHIENLTTELKIRTAGLGARARSHSRDSHSPEPRDNSSSTGSVGTVHELDALKERVHDVEQQLQDAVAMHKERDEHAVDLDGRVRILETRLAPSSSPRFSLLEMSNALADQFKVIRNDHNTLSNGMKSGAAMQAEINTNYELMIAEMQATIRSLESTVARLQLTPAARALSSTRHRSPSPHRGHVHARSRSPVDSSNKRSRASSPDSSILIMGPVARVSSTPPDEFFRIYMDARLPNFPLPEAGRMNIGNRHTSSDQSDLCTCLFSIKHRFRPVPAPYRFHK
ncbi:hypothetical protein C8R45DRAFT_1101359 [Mycena sanguinolenta]|nr:hypothetical protein C8R45DRAFT_1101359 [Mycena sanguinolenta]